MWIFPGALHPSTPPPSPSKRTPAMLLVWTPKNISLLTLRSLHCLRHPPSNKSSQCPPASETLGRFNKLVSLSHTHRSLSLLHTRNVIFTLHASASRPLTSQA
ncbi:hypothetical protein BsWGS_24689 [Bradybaena similaris]